MDRIAAPENIIKINSETEQNTALEKAREVLLSGGIVACPTESFYGLAVDIKNEKAIEKLFSLKKREKGKPILILLPDILSLEKYVTDIPEKALMLIKKFWPGGLTMLFNAAPEVSALLTAGTGKIGARYSSHPLVTALAKTISSPVTGTSSNISGQPPCISANEVFDYFGTDVDLILDNGHTNGGSGSTVLDITVDPCVVLREGMISGEDIKKILYR